MPDAAEDAAVETVRMLEGVGAIAEGFDLFLLDQWGVIHNGDKAHPGAVAAMERLRDEGRTVVIVSNSGKRSVESYHRLDGVGVDRALYLDVVTSGETVHRCLATRPDPFYRSLGRRALVLAWDDDRGVIEGTGVEETAALDEAEFVLCAGTDRQNLDEYTPVLSQALARGLPMVCANPDRISVAPDGSLKLCPGAVAEAYEAMGGTVRWHGKPTREIYEWCGRIAGGLDRAIGIGDSLLHDIAGAWNAGVPSMLITGGIHGHELPRPASAADVSHLAASYGVRPPEFAAELFRW